MADSGGQLREYVAKRADLTSEGGMDTVLAAATAGDVEIGMVGGAAADGEPVKRVSKPSGPFPGAAPVGEAVMQTTASTRSPKTACCRQNCR